MPKRTPKKKRSTRGRPRTPDFRTSLTLRVSETERETLLSHARTFTAGNVSAWIRFAALNFAPFPDQLATLKILHGTPEASDA